ncbi:F-box domain [Dillenia turbinata]|uniref:F-box domain n=1 Tax=Dillenia turbinata TaxID=194707 RepID=A0AAN8WF10_9MAGN
MEKEKEKVSRDGGGNILEKLPDAILTEILRSLDLETLSSLSSVSRSLNSSVCHLLLSFSSLDLTSFSPDSGTLGALVSRHGCLKNISVDCLRLHDRPLENLLGEHVVELNLLKCSFLSYNFLVSIGTKCPNLRLAIRPAKAPHVSCRIFHFKLSFGYGKIYSRGAILSEDIRIEKKVLMLELVGREAPEIFRTNLTWMLRGCSALETLSLKIRLTELDAEGFRGMEFLLPKTVRSLKLQPVRGHDMIHFMHEVGVNMDYLNLSSSFNIPQSSGTFGFKLQHLVLVLDVISDELIISITNALPLLIELDLEDRPTNEPSAHQDLTNIGLQSLCSLHCLTRLSLVRNKRNCHSASFKRTNDMGIFLLSEGCIGLESVRLGGFSKVSDAGFASVLHCCQNLEKFEVRNSLVLSDLAFHDVTRAPCCLVEVRLLNCYFITSETVKTLASCRNLEVLDLCGCRSIADPELSSISALHNLTTLNLGGADITDSSLSVLGWGDLPITSLCLRGCKRVTNRGISLLLKGKGTINKTLAALDLGHMPGISDKAIYTIAEAGLGITDLSIRFCFFVTDSALEALAFKRDLNKHRKPIRRLDLFKCIGLSAKSSQLLRVPSFCCLWWLGVGGTCLASEGNAVIKESCRKRPWLTLCFEGCEIGCHDGWQFHLPENFDN